MGRPTDLTPDDVDVYFHQRSGDAWEAIHACETGEEDGTTYFESVCGIASGTLSGAPRERLYDRPEDARAARAPVCALCAETGAFGDTDGDR